jgi:hypothetical protein
VSTLDVDKIGTSENIRKLMKILLSKINAPEKGLTLYYAHEYPMLLFTYTDKERGKSLGYMVDMMRLAPPLRHKSRMFDSIFGRLYERVDNKYHSLVCFALERAKFTGFKTT